MKILYDKYCSEIEEYKKLEIELEILDKYNIDEILRFNI